MKITLFGATGKPGAQCLARALPVRHLRLG